MHRSKLKTSEVLVQALELLDNGKAWNNEGLRVYDYARGTETWCAIGAIQQVVYGQVTSSDDNRHPAAQLLEDVVKDKIYSWNDCKSAGARGFKSIKAGFCKAIKRALKEEERAT